ncbi:fumarylacetoacetase [Paraburkholderia caballeronis]|uniref:fumarylacetoacetase n=1 Tax=Paraburkholderia caballeronis TaxID=416943 RepID=UPI0010ECA310|nr:fumarylacetoacetase [Paraburkholderia caballeronis]TDV14368.1 fumarylacetoacetate hydrolase [Paraburkholderia caballeronis]TDV15894.1 fumarylacetoacetate hydrolase [Paraburkholderia caballeronis]TDV25155.1 fumarylacetoacetate hydrolase [Paraburkholderia caballeronis]
MSRTLPSDLQATLDPSRKSWIDSANDPHGDFPIQNLPFGVFSDARDAATRVGVAIGDFVVDLSALAGAGLLTLPAGAPADLFAQPALNGFIALGRAAWRSVRVQLSALLARDTATLRDDAALRERALVPLKDATLHLPVEIPGYTDFYSSKEHATNVGSMFRDPKNALLPNWSEMPIGYNGRASSVVVSGTPVRRPNGQLKLPDHERPVFGACRKLDIELETGFVIGRGNALGEPVACARAEDHIFGMVLLNDWSARDIQQWEYVPLGPFNAKTFATSISPWIVTLDALEPFRVAQPAQEPQPLAYLRHDGDHAFDIALEVRLRAEGAPEATTIARTNFRHMYWTMAQQLAHHTVSGCNTRVGDLMGSGTISGPTEDSFGSLLELTWNGKKPLELNGGGARSFIEDGDELTLAGWCQGDGYRVGFGTCVGKILPAAK